MTTQYKYKTKREIVISSELVQSPWGLAGEEGLGNVGPGVRTEERPEQGTHTGLTPSWRGGTALPVAVGKGLLV